MVFRTHPCVYNPLHQLTEHFQETKNRLASQKARTTVLEKETTKMKKNLHTLLDKGDTDNELIDELRNVLQETREELHSAK